MAKLTLTDIASGFQSNTAANANNALIETSLENTLSRDGTGPNQMEADLDMNGHNILNTSGLTIGGVNIIPTGATTLPASGMIFTPSGSISATNVQSAIEELDSEKALLAGSSSQVFSVADDTALTSAIPYSKYLDSSHSVLKYIPIVYHAAIKDGTSTQDVTQYFQAAHDALGTNGGIIYVPAGTYILNQTAQATQFTISKSNVSIVGDGMATQFKHTASGVVVGNQAVIMVRPLTGDISNIVLQDFRITGPTTNTGAAIFGDVRVCGIAIHDGSTAHNITDVWHNNITIEGMETACFTMNGGSGTNGCARVHYHGCIAKNSRQDGFNDWGGSNNTDVQILGCYATDLDGFGMEMSTCGGLCIQNNVVARTGQSGIGIEYGGAASLVNHVVITGNIIHDITTTGYPNASGISLGQSYAAQNTVIKKNVIARTGGYGIIVATGVADGINISENVIKDIGKNNVNTQGISWTSCTNITVKNNKISCGAGYNMTYGISQAGTGDSTNVVEGNDVFGFTVAAQSGNAPTRFVSQRKDVAITYAVNMTVDASAGDYFIVSMVDGTATNMGAPANSSGSGARITFRIKNTSAGALGTLTWNAVYKLAAWTQPATGTSRAITFQYDGTNWVEISRTAVDIPN